MARERYKCYSCPGAFSLACNPRLTINNSPQRKLACSRRAVPTSELTLPANYNILRDEAVKATKSALEDGLKLLEIQFPPVPNMATAALNQLLDENRVFTREFLRSFNARYTRDRLNVVFPDIGEASLAQSKWGEVPFTIRSLPEGKPLGPPNYVRLGEPYDVGGKTAPGLLVVINPGFNVSEWINMELLEGSDPIVLINGDLDKVRGGYYPRLFYPGLHAVRDRFLSRFESVYYIKQFSNGGTLLRRYGEHWTLFYRDMANTTTTVLESFVERPDFREVENILRQARTSELRAR